MTDNYNSNGEPESSSSSSTNVETKTETESESKSESGPYDKFIQTIVAHDSNNDDVRKQYAMAKITEMICDFVSLFENDVNSGRMAYPKDQAELLGRYIDVFFGSELPYCNRWKTHLSRLTEINEILEPSRFYLSRAYDGDKESLIQPYRGTYYDPSLQQFGK